MYADTAPEYALWIYDMETPLYNIIVGGFVYQQKVFDIPPIVNCIISTHRSLSVIVLSVLRYEIGVIYPIHPV